MSKAGLALRAARLAGFLALFAALLILYLSFLLFDFLPPASRGIVAAVYRLNFAGTVLGALLCPLFLPLPSGKTPGGGRRRLLHSVIFIVLVTLPGMVIRSLGLEFWLGSPPARAVLALSAGMFNPLGYGLFCLAWFHCAVPAPDGGRQPEAGRFASLGMALALIGAVAARQYGAPFLERAGLAADPLRAMSVLFALIKWIKAGLALCAIVCVTLIDRFALTGGVSAGAREDASLLKTGWPMILRLIALVSVFTILNSLVGMRFFPLVSGVAEAYRFYMPVVAPAVPALCLLAGKPDRFLRVLLPPATALFILLPCLPLFHNYPGFLMAAGSLIAIVHYTMWVVCSVLAAALCRGGFWFYACAAAVQTTSVFSFFGSFLGPLIPAGTEMMALVSALAAVAFVFLSFSILTRKTGPDGKRNFAPVPGTAGFAEPELSCAAGDDPAAVSLPARFLSRMENFRAESFTAHGLTGREAEVAELVLRGMENARIAEKLFISERTVKKHVGLVLEKYGAKRRPEFMAKFYGGGGGRRWMKKAREPPGSG